jgi:hypothetical protein
MELYLDTEFNDDGGSLISMALVAEDGREFYEVLECLNPGQWVAANVMPVLGKAPVGRWTFQMRLRDFLNATDTPHVVSDHPIDLAYLCQALHTGGGNTLDTGGFTLEFRPRLGHGMSTMPHNALADARAIALAAKKAREALS